MKRLVWMGLLLGAGVMLLWLRPGGGREPVRSGARVANEGRLVAWMDGHAYSEPVRILVAPGEVVEGIVLRLRERCVLEGTFSELLRQSHDLRLEAGGHVQDVETKSGFFVFDDLPPGPGSVAVLHDDGSTGPRVEFTLTPTKTVRVEVPVR